MSHYKTNTEILCEKHELFSRHTMCFELHSGLKPSYQVDIAELVEPEVVDGGGDGWKFVSLEAGITESDGGTQPGQNPPV